MNNNYPWNQFQGPNLAYLLEQYDLYVQSPDHVEEEIAALFQQYGSPVDSLSQSETKSISGNINNNLDKILRAIRLADAIRIHGHQNANIYPLNNGKQDPSKISMEFYGLSEQDLVDVPAALIINNPPKDIRNGLEAINYLRSVYTESIAFEITHITDSKERQWLQDKIEGNALNQSHSLEEKKELLERLTKIEGFEKFIHRTFVGAKRFSIEGLDALVVLIDELVNQAGITKTKQVNIGMAHRGRLNVLTHVLNKPYEMMFAEFAHVPSKAFLPKDGSLEIAEGWFGDVKYHKGATYRSNNGVTVQLAYNPSHLEVVSPVVTGQTRAAQEVKDIPGYPKQDKNAAFAILVHGDAAFPGQGVVTEVLNYSRVRGFQTGGSIHIIANNMIGFTTEQFDSRSTNYSSDPAKGFEVPVIHVNADKPEAVLEVARLAFEYRRQFSKDIVIDLIGYRRYGHNEMDEPSITNPLMYHIVHKHPTVRQIYGDQLVEEKVLNQSQVEMLDETILKEMQEAYDRVKELPQTTANEVVIPQVVLDGYPDIPTGVEEEKLSKANAELLTWAKEFTPFKKLEKILRRREEPFTGSGKIDWGHAETLAFATILQDGHSIRLSGQDAQRGTFSHRHLVLHDEKTGEELIPMHFISDSAASFVVHNSPLTEAAILGYEFGYTLEDKNTLTIWEAQYGDFANMAQVMFDNFISSARAKWGLKSGLVMLLPHGAEGQGPEHTSARLERYLQLSAENNWTVANLSSAANYFHILRRQAESLNEEFVRPLLIVSPKSLLRNPLVGADVSELVDGKFQAVIEQPNLGGQPDEVKKIVFASGKMAIDLAEKVKSGTDFNYLHIIRVEQLYPFPKDEILDILGRYPNVELLTWAQEEPQNMGSWNYALPYLLEMADGRSIAYTGRVHRSSPAEGDADTYKVEQGRIIEEALKSL
ncbi:MULTISPECIES: 2-oxoglutarate dehydrogenase E1 component [unclassified Psychrobacillus]|uniref:2-oxoglutarate dehydrogenase E1 component n=1 Tax=unclassified Psychrobacillus TaxID=2636677 RepID=UPI00146D2006|nr:MULTISPECIES: 2-oxoglutarate dehydrogenase E1 component [unclassified Psychrobacillus]MCM3356999.1 2-oxoglutarate dehydrogenase E1 component [Psychrobacillus sp. MER TA 171]NME04769.1 2-oxoglutarate dehydrogenase E1 component [Psychrobacillus sp. BL-248-WT-3]